MTNRKIKFRAFHPTMGMMSREELLEDGINPMMDEVQINNKKVIFMQWSGMVDKNGVEIYEEDTILFDIPDVKRLIFDVVFINGVFGIDLNGQELQLNDLENIEVIGNNYEKRLGNSLHYKI